MGSAVTFPAPPAVVLFTDLDGTLLDYDGYTWAPAEEALRALARRGVPIVFCSSKTWAEQRVYQEELGIREPAIVENGSAVVAPRGRFGAALDVAAGSGRVSRLPEHDVVVFGVRRKVVLEGIRAIATELAIDVRGYSDMTVDEVREMTGLPEPAARRALRREFSETVRVVGGAARWDRFMRALEERGLRCFGNGPTGTVVGAGADKGTAVNVVAGLFRTVAPVTTVGIGDAANDEPMLRVVDRAFLVEGRGGGWADLSVAGLERVRGVGPVGWDRAVQRLLDETSET